MDEKVERILMIKRVDPVKLKIGEVAHISGFEVKIEGDMQDWFEMEVTGIAVVGYVSLKPALPLSFWTPIEGEHNHG